LVGEILFHLARKLKSIIEDVESPSEKEILSKLFGAFLRVENSLGFDTNLVGGDSNIFLFTLIRGRFPF